ncbi:hypothetical protein P7H25_14015 [Paenibacillus larvae]|nr:hypothetical protein [Paenibacillus larvae]MDT2256515.1 hypothetical protein [Paenibacillus larvae]
MKKDWQANCLYSCGTLIVVEFVQYSCPQTATLIFNVSDKLPLVMSMAAYVLIYVGYYFLTVRSYCNIVRKN